MARLLSYPCLEAVYREMPFAQRQTCLKRIPALRQLEPRVAYTFNEVIFHSAPQRYSQRSIKTIVFDDESWEVTEREEMDEVIQYFLARPGTRIRHLVIRNLWPKLPIEIAGRRIEELTMETHQAVIPRNYFDELRAAGVAFGDVCLETWGDEDIYGRLVGIPMDTLIIRTELLPRPEQLLGLSVRNRLKMQEHDIFNLTPLSDFMIERLSNFHIVTSTWPNDFGLSFSYRHMIHNRNSTFSSDLFNEPEFQQGLRRIGARKVRKAGAYTLRVSDRMELLLYRCSDKTCCIKNIPRGSAKKFVKKWSRDRTEYCSSRLRPRNEMH